MNGKKYVKRKKETLTNWLLLDIMHIVLYKLIVC